MGKSWAKRFPDKLKQQKKRENERRREDLNLRDHFWSTSLAVMACGFARSILPQLKVFPKSVEIRIDGPATTTSALCEAVTTDIWSLNVETTDHFFPESDVR